MKIQPLIEVKVDLLALGFQTLAIDETNFLRMKGYDITLFAASKSAPPGRRVLRGAILGLTLFFGGDGGL